MAFGGRDPRKGLPLALAVARGDGPAARGGRPRGGPARAFRRTGADVHGDLPRAGLDALIAGALAVVYLSEDEGFGLPVIEAMALGTPVVTGDAPATREVAGDAGLLVDPADVAGSAAAHVARLARRRRAARGGRPPPAARRARRDVGGGRRGATLRGVRGGMKVLVLVTRFPHPGTKGDQSRAWSWIAQLARSHDVTVLTTGRPERPAWREELRGARHRRRGPRARAPPAAR